MGAASSTAAAAAAGGTNKAHAAGYSDKAVFNEEMASLPALADALHNTMTVRELAMLRALFLRSTSAALADRQDQDSQQIQQQQQEVIAALNDSDLSNEEQIRTGTVITASTTATTTTTTSRKQEQDLSDASKDDASLRTAGNIDAATDAPANMDLVPGSTSDASGYETLPPGFLARDSFVELFGELGSEAVMRTVLDTVDPDRNGLSFVEFAAVYSTVMRGSFEERARLMFAMFDADKDGFVDRKEMREFIIGLSPAVKEPVRVEKEREARKTVLQSGALEHVPQHLRSKVRRQMSRAQVLLHGRTGRMLDDSPRRHRLRRRLRRHFQGEDGDSIGSSTDDTGSCDSSSSPLSGGGLSDETDVDSPGMSGSSDEEDSDLAGESMWEAPLEDGGTWELHSQYDDVSLPEAEAVREIRSPAVPADLPDVSPRVSVSRRHQRDLDMQLLEAHPHTYGLRKVFRDAQLKQQRYGLRNRLRGDYNMFEGIEVGSVEDVLLRDVDVFFGSKQRLNLAQFELRGTKFPESAVLSGFGVLDFFRARLGLLFEKRLNHDTSRPPRAAGWAYMKKLSNLRNHRWIPHYLVCEGGFLFVYRDPPPGAAAPPGKGAAQPSNSTSLQLARKFSQRGSRFTESFDARESDDVDGSCSSSDSDSQTTSASVDSEFGRDPAEQKAKRAENRLLRRLPSRWKTLAPRVSSMGVSETLWSSRSGGEGTIAEQEDMDLTAFVHNADVTRTIPLEECRVKLISASSSDSTFVVKAKGAKGSFKRLMRVSSRDEAISWVYILLANSQEIPSNRFASFAPVRPNNRARWFVDGRDYFLFAFDLIRRAKSEILITDWWLSPELFLDRDSEGAGIESRLDVLLRRKASEGVNIRILVWSETTIAMSINSLHTKKALEGLHKNIQVLRHPGKFPISWTHHQKTLIVDQDIATVGGLDLCFGRFDDAEHRLTDESHLHMRWPGKDYCNESKEVLIDVHNPFNDGIDRSKVQRQPWHDIHMAVDGQAARDVARNFIQRWNHHVRHLSSPFAPLFPDSRPQVHRLSSTGIVSSRVTSTALRSREALPELQKLNRSLELKHTGSIDTADSGSFESGVLMVPLSSALKFIGLAVVDQDNAKKRPSSVAPDAPNVKDETNEVSTAAAKGPAITRDAVPDGVEDTIEEINGSIDDAGQVRHDFKHILPQSGYAKSVNVQLVRSISLWSGSSFTEVSIHEAYCDFISKAEHCIYIENQYFISSTAHGPRNNIAQRLVEKITQKHRAGEKFRVVVVLPAYPTGDSWSSSASIQMVMRWQYQTISRSRNSIHQQLKREFGPKFDPNTYLRFFALRRYDVLNGRPVTEQVYVHSKLMVVDDCRAIIGSANINDRSMLGTRDSEICCVVEDTAFSERLPNGKPRRFKVGEFCHGLRMNCWREHLGLANDRSQDGDIVDMVRAFDRIWVPTAENNTRLFEEFFKAIPSDRLQTWGQFDDAQKHDALFLRAFRREDAAEEHARKHTEQMLGGVKGHVVMFPMAFMGQENLKPSLGSAEKWLSADLFQ